MKKPVAALSLFLGLCLLGPRLDAAELNLAVADSLCDTMRKVGEQYRQQNDIEINYVCKSSGLLAKGLSGDALMADIFFSASQEWMDFVIEKGLVSPKQVVSPWGNTLVAATAKGSKLNLKSLRDLSSSKVTQILIGDPSTAPFGRHAKLALDKSNLWETVKNKVETRKNHSLLAESLAKADGGSVGILFKTHLDNSDLRLLFSIENRLHEPIRYYVAPLKTAAGKPELANFLKFLRGPIGTQTFRDAGFSVQAR